MIENKLHEEANLAKNIDLDRILAEHVEKPEAVLNRYSWNKSAKTLYSLICRCT